MKYGLKFLISKGLRKYLNPPAIRDSIVHKTASVRDYSTIVYSTVGRYCSINDHVKIEYTKIGSFCGIGANSVVGPGNHHISYVSHSQVFQSGRTPQGVNFSTIPYNSFTETTIGNDVYIGTHVLVKGGVTIADGAVVGMGSVVTHNIGPYEIWAGNPARFIRKRFDDETIEKLLALKWWDWPEEKLRQYGDDFVSPEKLFEALARREGK